jgi:hypothetical protein
MPNFDFGSLLEEEKKPSPKPKSVPKKKKQPSRPNKYELLEKRIKHLELEMKGNNSNGIIIPEKYEEQLIFAINTALKAYKNKKQDRKPYWNELLDILKN